MSMGEDRVQYCSVWESVLQLKKLVASNIVIIVAALAVIGLLVFSTISTTLKNQLVYSNQLVLENGAALLEDFIKRSKDAVLNIAIDPHVQSRLAEFHNGRTSIENIEKYVESNWTHRNSISGGGGVLDIYPYAVSEIYDYSESDGRYIEIDAEPWMADVIVNDGAFVVKTCMIDTTPYIRIAMLARSVPNWPNELAIVALNIKTDALLPLFYRIRLEDSNAPYLVDEYGEIILPYENTHGLRNNDLLSSDKTWWIREEYVFINTNVPSLNWKLLGVIEENELLERSRDIRKTFLIVGTTVVVFLLVVSMFFSVWITRPISNLARAMSKVESGKIREIEIEPYLGNETRLLYRQFNYMIRRINSLIDEVYVAQINEKEAELLALQQQINPHFLYNTLDSIAWMSMAYKAEDIRYMVMSLASMMRYSLNKGDNYISIRDELEQVRNYVGIQEIRYDNKFTTSIQCNNEALDYRIIKLIIQPLVENAIVHGFKDGGECGHISIVVDLIEDHVVLQVMNDGGTIDLDKIRRILAANDGDKLQSYGLRNVNDRLVKSFGKASAIVFSVKNDRTIATISIATKLLTKGTCDEPA